MITLADKFYYFILIHFAFSHLILFKNFKKDKHLFR